MGDTGVTGAVSGVGPVGAVGSPGVGLRERKKRRMYRAVSEAAIGLFLERGFEKVSVAEVAAAAEISKPTLFRYFPAKEDLVLHRFADHEDEPARVVRGRPSGRSPLDALHRHFLDGLDRRDPVTGLSDEPGVLAFHRLLYGTPSLVARLYGYLERSETALAEALGEAGADGPEANRSEAPCSEVGGPGADGVAVGADARARAVDARLAAGQIVAVQRILAMENRRRMAAGERAVEVRGDAVTAADGAFAQLRAGPSRFA